MGPTAPTIINGQISLPEDDDNVWAEARRQPQSGIETTTPGSAHDILKAGGDRAATNPFLKRKPVPPTVSTSRWKHTNGGILQVGGE